MDPVLDFPAAPAQTPAPPWLLTFADLLSLLLSFFVLLFATMRIEPADWNRVVAPLSGYFSGQVLLISNETAPAKRAAAPADSDPRHDLNYVQSVLENLAAADPGLAGARIERRPRAVALILPPTATVAHWIGGQPAPLASVARALGGLDNAIEVAVTLGPVPGPPETAAWPLALDRAQSVGAELRRLGVDRPVTATGAVDPRLRGGEAELALILGEIAALRAGAAGASGGDGD